MSDPRDPRDHALSRIYREGSWPEPGRQIDAAILAASRRAARERHSLVRRWAPPFALAATVVLTSAVVLRVVQEQPEVLSESVAEKSAARVKQATIPAEKAKAAEAKPPLPAERPVTAPPGFALQMDAAEAERLERAQRDLGLKQNFPANESLMSAQKGVPALKKEAPPGTRADQIQRQPDPQQELRARATSPREQPPASAPLSVFGAAPPAPAPAAVARPAAPTPAVAPSAPAPAATTAPTAPEATRGAAANSLAITSASGVGALKAPERSPQAWLEQVRKLIGEGKLQEADRELTEFKKRYPDYVLPEDLR